MDVASTPDESARIMRWLRRASDPAERATRLRNAPLPTGSSIVFRVAGSKELDQDRLYLSATMAASMRKVWGIVSSLRPEVLSANTATPASAQIVIRINWHDEQSDRYRDFFARVTAYSASYEPRYATGNSCSLKLGDIVCGLLERPHSDRNTAALGCWDFGRLDEWIAFSPRTDFGANQFNASSSDIADLPQLGGTYFDRSDRFSMSIAPPLVTPEVLRTISARTQDLRAADVEIRHIAQSRCDGSFGCQCVRCSARQNTIANSGAPSPLRTLVLPLPLPLLRV